MENKKLVCAYIRLSVEDIRKEKDYSKSIYNQIAFIKSYAKSFGYDIDKEYIDDGFSGANYERPAFENLRKDIEKGLVGVVITKDISRLGRDMIDTVYYISEYFIKYDVRYIAINDNFDSFKDDDFKDISLMIRTLVNEKVVKDSSVKRKQIADKKTSEGQFIGFIAPYGYKIIKKEKFRTLEIDPYAAEIVKRIFTEVASGKSREEVAIGLNSDKIVPPVLYLKMTPSKNKKYYYDWSGTTIFRIIKNATYTGRIVKRKSIKKDHHEKNRIYIPVDRRELIDNCHPAIISDNLFDEANSKIRSIKVKERQTKNNYSGMFKDLIFCGECGNMMTCSSRVRNGNRTYRFECNKTIERKLCSNRSIAQSKLDNIVKIKIKEIIDNYIDKDEIINSTSKDIIKTEKLNLKITNLTTDIDIHNKNIKNLYIRKAKKEISLEEFMDLKKEETLIKEEKEKRLKELYAKKNIDDRKQDLLQKYNSFISDNNLSNETLKYFIDKIVIYKDNTVELVFNFGLSESKKVTLF